MKTNPLAASVAVCAVLVGAAATTHAQPQHHSSRQITGGIVTEAVTGNGVPESFMVADPTTRTANGSMDAWSCKFASPQHRDKVLALRGRPYTGTCIDPTKTTYASPQIMEAR